MRLPPRDASAYGRSESLQRNRLGGHSIPAALRGIPIVFAVVNDLVAQGIIPSMAHPGGNITGFSFMEYSMVGKSLEMLRQIAPKTSRVAVKSNPDTYPYYEIHLKSFEIVARQLGLNLLGAPARSPTEIDEIIGRLGKEDGSSDQDRAELSPNRERSRSDAG